MTSAPSLDTFFSRLRSAGFFTRLFSWKRLLSEADAAEQRLSATLTAARNEAGYHQQENLRLREQLAGESARLSYERDRYAELKTAAEAQRKELAAAAERIAAEESIQEERAAAYERRVEALNTLTAELQANNERNATRASEELAAYHTRLEHSWQTHEQAVEDTLRSIAARYGFVRCTKDEFPYPGAPDNVIRIGGLYTIFDAKSPKNPEDLENFPTYLKQQAEAMKKYCKYEDVRRDVFLVIPLTAAESIETFIYPLADYTVYIITPEAMLPILQMLKTLETYSFTEQISPEDRDRLVRYIAKLSHTAKRSLQIDTYLAQELIAVLRESSSLPEEFRTEIAAKEQNAKLNPPLEKRTKTINVEDVAAGVDAIERDILGWSRI